MLLHAHLCLVAVAGLTANPGARRRLTYATYQRRAGQISPEEVKPAATMSDLDNNLVQVQTYFLILNPKAHA